MKVEGEEVEEEGEEVGDEIKIQVVGAVSLMLLVEVLVMFQHQLNRLL